MERGLLVLDLDETLIYGTETKLNREPDFICAQFNIYRRPYFADLLAQVRDLYHLAVWTSSSSAYMRCVVSNLFPSDTQLTFTWSRDRCTPKIDPRTYSQNWLKDLRKVKRKGYSLDRVVVVDDTPAKLQRSYGNLVRVSEWLGQEDDAELLRLGAYLASIHDVPSFRSIEKRGWRNVETIHGTEDSER